MNIFSRPMVDHRSHRKGFLCRHRCCADAAGSGYAPVHEYVGRQGQIFDCGHESHWVQQRRYSGAVCCPFDVCPAHRHCARYASWQTPWRGRWQERQSPRSARRLSSSRSTSGLPTCLPADDGVCGAGLPHTSAPWTREKSKLLNI